MDEDTPRSFPRIQTAGVADGITATIAAIDGSKSRDENQVTPKNKQAVIGDMGQPARFRCAFLVRAETGKGY